jgi:acetolactate synthase regulatory subunit
MRRLLGPGFTASATKDLAVMIERYVDLLVVQLGKVADGKRVQDMSHWFEWTVSSCRLFNGSIMQEY